MYTEIGDTIVVDHDQEGDITLLTWDSETEEWRSFGLTFEEAVFFSDRVQEVVSDARDVREANKEY